MSNRQMQYDYDYNSVWTDDHKLLEKSNLTVSGIHARRPTRPTTQITYQRHLANDRLSWPLEG